MHACVHACKHARAGTTIRVMAAHWQHLLALAGVALRDGEPQRAEAAAGELVDLGPHLAGNLAAIVRLPQHHLGRGACMQN